MEAIPRPPRTTPELLHMRKNWRNPKTAERSPEHTKVWTEPHPTTNKPRRIPVVYYLSRNGNLEHPHFIEVPLHSSDGLYLRDVIDRLNSLRGNGMAASYSWSSKRSYKNGFVWHDLSENDYIYPAHGQEYILKGSEIVVAGGDLLNSPEFEKSGTGTGNFPAVSHRRNQSWSVNEYKVYTGKLAADAGTQTDDKRRRRKETIKEEEEVTREEISVSPPPSDSSPETLESLMKAEGKLIVRPETEDRNPTDGNKAKASSVLMQLISCGSISIRECGSGKDNAGLSLISHYKSRIMRNNGRVEDGVVLRKSRRSEKKMVVEDKEYFSGSLVETIKEKFPAIKRSNSYSGNR